MFRLSSRSRFFLLLPLDFVTQIHTLPMHFSLEYFVDFDLYPTVIYALNVIIFKCGILALHKTRTAHRIVSILYIHILVSV